MSSPIANWLKKIFTANTIGVIAGIASVVIAWFAFVRDGGGELAVSYAGQQIHESGNVTYYIVTSDSLVDITDKQFWPTVINTESHAVKDLRMEYSFVIDGLRVYRGVDWEVIRDNGEQGTFALRYSEPTVFAHSQAEAPLTMLRLYTPTGSLKATSYITYEGLRTPLVYGVDINYVLYPRQRNQALENWHMAASRQAESLNMPRHGRYVFVSQGTVTWADSIFTKNEDKHAPAEKTEPQKTVSPVTEVNDAGLRIYHSNGQYISRLDNLSCTIDTTGQHTVARLTFAPIDRSGLTVAFFTFFESSDEATLWNRMFHKPGKKYKKNYCTRNVFLQQGDTVVEVKLPNGYNHYELAHLMSPDNDLAAHAVLRDNMLVNTSDAPLGLVLRYTDARDSSGWITSTYIAPRDSFDMKQLVGVPSDISYEFLETDYLDNALVRAIKNYPHLAGKILAILILVLAIGLIFFWESDKSIMFKCITTALMLILAVAIYGIATLSGYVLFG